MSVINKAIVKRSTRRLPQAHGRIPGVLRGRRGMDYGSATRPCKARTPFANGWHLWDPWSPQLTVHNVIAEGDFVTAYGDMTMKDKDGAVVPYAYCDIYHFRGGKIVALRAFVIQTEAKSQTIPGAS